MPLVRPETKASAIWQKNGLAIASVNGRTIEFVPPQLKGGFDDCAGNLIDVSNMTITVRHRIAAERIFSFISGLSVACECCPDRQVPVGDPIAPLAACLMRERTKKR